MRRQRLEVFHEADIVLHLSQCRHEPESVTVYHGTFQHHHDTELLRTRNIGEDIPVVDGAGSLRRLAVAGVGDVELGPPQWERPQQNPL